MDLISTIKINKAKGKEKEDSKWRVFYLYLSLRD
jgi:hypothetical protein